MNNYKNVLKNLNKETKVELETQKVELASISQLKSQAKECRSTTSKLLSIRSDYVKNAKSLRSFGEILQEQAKRLRELTLDLDKKLKDLGVETPKEIEYFIQEANDFEATGKDAIKRTR